MVHPYQRSLWPYFFRSTFAHTGVLVFVLLFSWFFKVTGLDQILSSDKVTIVESVVRVDVVSMPKHTLKELKAIDMSSVKMSDVEVEAKNEKVEEEVKEQAPDSPDQTEFKKASEKKDFASMLKEIGKKKVKVTKEKAEKENNQIDSKLKGKLAMLVAQGNKISKGNAIVGATEGEAGPFQMYLSSIIDRVRPFWKLPSYLIDQNLTCRIRLYLNAQGNLVKASIYSSSGNSEYDQRALSAVEKSAPFAVPDDNILSRVQKGEIVLGFPL